MTGQGHDIAEAIARYHAELDPQGVALVAVSKFHPVESLREAYEAGQRIFGESRAQELAVKAPALPDDVAWHFIGHLQTNKVRQVVGHAAMIQSVDSLRLLDAIDAEARRQGVTARVLMQVHVAAEETKTGFTQEELYDYFGNEKHASLTNTHLCGMMAMATNTDDMRRVEADFRQARAAFDRIRESAGLRGFDTLSMGMSHDYRLAVDCGSTMVRIGTDIFGEREY